MIALSHAVGGLSAALMITSPIAQGDGDSDHSLKGDFVKKRRIPCRRLRLRFRYASYPRLVTVSRDF
jgi:hypothetical protein